MTRKKFQHDVQGRFLGIPYDFRLPTLPKVVSRILNPRAGMISPRVFGAGWTLNLAHPGSWALLGAAGALATILACVL